MRAGLSTIQQTLTAEASTILNQSIAEAARRNHGQTTPLHVAATLLASPSGFLRQACIRSHPNSSHPLQCRALELCFSVALERLPTAQSPSQEPPISNALMAALKRAQAHQRRGCPEQQQQPLLAVKVELEQLVISILDDPSVSRVMREASFSSPAVKATIEQSLTSGNGNYSTSNRSSSPYRMMCLGNGNSISTNNVNKNSNLNLGCGEEAKKVLDIMMKIKKKNPVLVGDAGIDGVLREVLGKIEKDEIEIMKGVRVLSVDGLKDKIGELGNIIDTKIGSGGGVIVDLGDLKWLVEGVGGGGVSVLGRTAVAEVAKVVARFSGAKVWLIGTAACETYLRCQVYHSTMESDWDLQAVPITLKSPLPGMFPRVGSERVLSSPLESLNTLKAVPNPLPSLTRRVPENLSPSQKSSTLCPQCSINYDKEVAKFAALEKSFSDAKQGSTKPSLPQWLQTAKTPEDPQGNDQTLLSKQKTQELQKKWRDTCLHLHPKFHQSTLPHHGTGSPVLSIPSLSIPTLGNPTLLSRPSLLPKLQAMPKPLTGSLQLKPLGETLRPVSQLPTAKPLGESLQLNMNSNRPSEAAKSPPSSPVRTELVLGRKGVGNNNTVPAEKANEDQVKDLLSCISSESPPQEKSIGKFANALDADTYKKLLKGLMEKAWWQAEAASSVASAITRCRLGNGKRRSGGGSRGDIWLLFAGPDRVGKKKMAYVLADQICGTSPVVICLGSRRDDEETDTGFRGKTATDRIAEAVRRNPFSVIVLEDIDEADMLVRGGIKRAIERGRLTDSHGREVGLGNAIFIVTGDWSTTNGELLRDSHFVDEKKIHSTASGSWQLGLIVREKSANKRRANWSGHEDRQSKARKDMGLGLSLDLNLSVITEIEDDKATYGSHNSSGLTINNEDELGLANQHFTITAVPNDLMSNVDDSIVFKPVDANFVRREIKKTISVRFSSVFDDDDLSIEVGDDVLEKILGGLWHDRTSLEEWVENVLTPGFEQLKPRLPSGDKSGSLVRLVVESDSSSRGKSLGNADWLPSAILV